MLHAYRERHGDLNTRYTQDKKDKKISHFIFNLRKFYKEGKLTASQIEQLSKMDFTFDLEEKAKEHWLEMFGQLKEFKLKYGHCAVPESWKNNRNLAQWVILQRRRHKEMKLQPEFKKLLDKQGFLWNPMDGRYERKTKD